MDDYFSNLANIQSLQEAAEQATQEQLKQGVPVVRMEEDAIYKLHPDGRKERLAHTLKKPYKLSQNRFYIQK